MAYRQCRSKPNCITMWASLMKMLGIQSVDYSELMSRGAVIVDVRTKGEYAGGHIKGSMNIPLDRLQSDYKKLKKDSPVITCCASWMRSGSAKGFLKGKGFEVVNGGSWSGLQQKIRK